MPMLEMGSVSSPIPVSRMSWSGCSAPRTIGRCDDWGLSGVRGRAPPFPRRQGEQKEAWVADRERLDMIAKVLGTATSRRTGLMAALGAALGWATVSTDGVNAKGRGPATKGKGSKGGARSGPEIQGPCGNGRRKDNICTNDGECCTGVCNKRLGKHNTDGKGRCRCLKRGKQCQYDRNCCGTLECQQGRCAGRGPGPEPDAPIPTGSPCTPEDTCASQQATCRTYASGNPVGLYCLLPNGQSCSGSSDCVQQSCVSGTCAQATVIPIGDACTQQDTCAGQSTCVAYTSNDPSGTYCLLGTGGSCDGSVECTSQLCLSGQCTLTPESCDVCSTCTYQTIQAAINGMAEGSTIKIGEGEYTEDLTIDKDLTLRACNGEPVSIENATPPRRVIQRNSNSGDPVSLTITDITIDRNTGSEYGGGIWGYFDLTLNGSTVIQSGRAYQHGGGVELGDGSGPWDIEEPLPCTLIMEGDAAIRFNEADEIGGGVWFGCRGGEIIIRGNASITNNATPGDGGGIATADEVTLTLTGDAKILGNYAGDDGGGFSCGEHAEVYLSGNSYLSQNRSADDGGGGFTDSYGSISMSGTARVEDNTSDWSGGGLLLYEFGTLSMDEASTLRSNTAAYFGGGADIDGYYQWTEDYDTFTPALTMAGQSVIENNRTLYGGDSTWRGGGGVRIAGGSPALLNGQSSIRNNSSAENGGGIRSTGDVVLRDTSSIEGNSADGTGGGVFVSWFYDDRPATVRVGANATLANNTPNNCDGPGTC